MSPPASAPFDYKQQVEIELAKTQRNVEFWREQVDRLPVGRQSTSARSALESALAHLATLRGVLDKTGQ